MPMAGRTRVNLSPQTEQVNVTSPVRVRVGWMVTVPTYSCCRPAAIQPPLELVLYTSLPEASAWARSWAWASWGKAPMPRPHVRAKASNMERIRFNMGSLLIS